MAKIAGTAHIKVNGANFSTDIEDGYTINFLKTKATPIASSDGAIHYAENVNADKISGTLLTTADLNPAMITSVRDATVQIHLANGSVAVLRNAFFTGDAGVSSKDGKFQIEFTGIGMWV